MSPADILSRDRTFQREQKTEMIRRRSSIKEREKTRIFKRLIKIQMNGIMAIGSVFIFLMNMNREFETKRSRITRICAER